jgi:hypothetical protein
MVFQDCKDPLVLLAKKDLLVLTDNLVIMGLLVMTVLQDPRETEVDQDEMVFQVYKVYLGLLVTQVFQVLWVTLVNQVLLVRLVIQVCPHQWLKHDPVLLE